MDIKDIRIILRQCEDIIDESGHKITSITCAKNGFYLEVLGPREYNVHFIAQSCVLRIMKITNDVEMPTVKANKVYLIHDPECFDKFKNEIDRIVPL